MKEVILGKKQFVAVVICQTSPACSLQITPLLTFLCLCLSASGLSCTPSEPEQCCCYETFLFAVDFKSVNHFSVLSSVFFHLFLYPCVLCLFQSDSSTVHDTLTHSFFDSYSKVSAGSVSSAAATSLHQCPQWLCSITFQSQSDLVYCLWMCNMSLEKCHFLKLQGFCVTRLPVTTDELTVRVQGYLLSH